MADDFRRYCFTPNSKYIKEEPESPSDENFSDPYDLDHPYDFKFSSGKRSLSTSDIKSLYKQNQQRSSTKTSSSSQSQQSQRNKFISMAELIYHYERDTPDRFHSNRSQSMRPQNTSRPTLTVPQSPALHCKTRSRTRHILSQQEREERELEEIRKHKIKANPIPKCVLKGSKNLPEVPKKPVTVPSPFNITEIHATHSHSPIKQIQFKARPVPKQILGKPKDNKILPTEGPKQNFAKPVPFSFAKRDEEIMKRKEEKIKQMIDEEKKLASNFKAQPLPGAVKKHMVTVTAKSATSSHSSENKENHVRFEARPLPDLKKAYKPVLKHTQTICQPFRLASDKRAVEREMFHQALKEREAEQERLRQQMEKERQVMEEKAIMEWRAKLVHHPKPPPTIQPFVPAKSNAPVTVPETPKFVRRLNQAK